MLTNFLAVRFCRYLETEEIGTVIVNSLRKMMAVAMPDRSGQANALPLLVMMRN